MNIFKKGTFAISLLATAIFSTAAPAAAQDRWRDGDDTAAIAVGAGVVGLAVGAIAASNNDRYDRRYYNRGYQSDRYYDRGRRFDRRRAWQRNWRHNNRRWDRHDNRYDRRDRYDRFDRYDRRGSYNDRYYDRRGYY